ncbi:hypothetical protein PR048_020319 [Dryococelus australis]|uniref:Uncharacterized protein n=1 Tax=Dryococelus australis TaxID=614101 RepID=A0ABQ9H669_9NEOP|nr:hypothetical protein PR048_020319 [Dryococelus australis]
MVTREQWLSESGTIDTTFLSINVLASSSQHISKLVEGLVFLIVVSLLNLFEACFCKEFPYSVRTNLFRSTSNPHGILCRRLLLMGSPVAEAGWSRGYSSNLGSGGEGTLLGNIFCQADACCWFLPQAMDLIFSSSLPSTCSLLKTGAGMKGWGKREFPEETRRPTASSGLILTCENPMTQPGIEPSLPWWEAVAAIDLKVGVQTTPKVVKGVGKDMVQDGIDSCDNVGLEFFECVLSAPQEGITDGKIWRTGWRRLVCSTADDTIRLEHRLNACDCCTCSMCRGSILLKVSIVALILCQLIHKNIENVFDLTSRVHCLMEEHCDDAA